MMQTNVNEQLSTERARISAAFESMTSADLKRIANSSTTVGRWSWLEIDAAAKTLAARDEANRLRAERVAGETLNMNALAARVRKQREDTGLGLNVRFKREDGTPDEFSFATVERAEQFRASLVRQGRELLA